MPVLSEAEDWGEMKKEEAQTAYLDDVNKFVGMLGDALQSMKDNVILPKPERRFAVENTAAGIQRAGASPDLVESYEGTE